MKISEFNTLLDQDAVPNELSPVLQALWHEAKGNWDEAHQLAQSQRDQVGYWVHAHLHRVEGDDANAGYWYRRSGKPHSSAPLQSEWEEIVSALLPG
jgi:hypothetical protein